MGPLVSKQQLEHVDAAVERAVKDGAKVVLGGKGGRCRRATITSPRC